MNSINEKIRVYLKEEEEYVEICIEKVKKERRIVVEKLMKGDVKKITRAVLKKLPSHLTSLPLKCEVVSHDEINREAYRKYILGLSIHQDKPEIKIKSIDGASYINTITNIIYHYVIKLYNADYKITVYIKSSDNSLIFIKGFTLIRDFKIDSTLDIMNKLNNNMLNDLYYIHVCLYHRPLFSYD
jgi:hypothetical protein